MRRRQGRWFDVVASLGEAGWDLARAEYRVVASEVGQAGRKLGTALLLLAVGLFALFWAIGALTLVVVEVASLWLPRWGSALVALGLFVLTGLALTGVARSKLSSIEPPIQTVKRRLDEHREWWERKVAATPFRRTPSPRRGDGSESASSETHPS